MMLTNPLRPRIPVILACFLWTTLFGAVSGLEAKPPPKRPDPKAVRKVSARGKGNKAKRRVREINGGKKRIARKASLRPSPKKIGKAAKSARRTVRRGRIKSGLA